MSTEQSDSFTKVVCTGTERVQEAESLSSGSSSRINLNRDFVPMFAGRVSRISSPAVKLRIICNSFVELIDSSQLIVSSLHGSL